MAEDAAGAARFGAGDAVRTRTADPAGHTRLPRYVRGQTGRIVECTGRWPLADERAAGAAAPRVEPVYTVAFAARDLWTEAERPDRADEVTVDLWESYLEPAEADGPGRRGPGAGEDEK